jgi:hypothetical protein
MIVIIGDSFCADFYHRNLPRPKFEKQTWLQKDQASWVTDVIEHYNGDVEVYGFGGYSWWYSWAKANEDLQDRWHEVETVIFCHTSCSRINNAWNDNLYQTPNSRIGNNEEQLAAQLFFKHIYDENFQKYAFDQHIKNLEHTFKDIKTIHFTSTFEKRIIPDLIGLSGTVFTTPLFQISIGGLRGSEKKILHKINNHDPVRLNNHLTDLNNHALSRLVIDAIKNYSPGYKTIDFSKFGFDIVNPNACHWPDRYWGSK